MMKVENGSPQKSVSSFSDALNLGIREPLRQSSTTQEPEQHDSVAASSNIVLLHPDAGFHILITSYQLLVSDEKYFRRVKWQYMILDEAQAIKSSTRAIATSDLWQLVIVCADLNEHFKAIKDYFLLVIGDFFQTFLEESSLDAVTPSTINC
ncbi:hypothetical protein L2E82_16585 [Cichorium intybus]|uniref:Uncharacterized protein n=1 Tax=Cichorium intybus TaxID=13427 RepID=A0ACB9F6F1_CICIN|nr:hypothetical protein L2E82_16585 [Cichorium intybus]